jgi:phenylalanyl-tRNA synthetase beta chain
VPSWRPDVDGKADLVEEVMRIHGVDEIAPQPLVSHATVNGKILTTLQVRTRAAKRALASRGMMEAVTWSFIPAKHAETFGGGQTALKLANPIAADMSDMRPSLLPGLLAAAQRSIDRGFADVALFEVSGIYENDTPDTQRRVAAGVRRGTATLDGSGRAWSGNAKSVGVFDARDVAVLEACGAPVDRLQIEAAPPGIIRAVPARSSSGRRSCSARSASSTRRRWRFWMSTGRSAASRCSSTPSPSRRRNRPAPSRSWSFPPSRR